MKKVRWIGIGFIVLLAAALLLPPLIDLSVFKNHYLPIVEEALHRKVDVGEVRLHIIPTPSIRISALKVADNPAFSAQPFFSAQQFRLQLRFWPLLRGKFETDEFVLDKPTVNLIKKADGTFNFADIGKGKEAAKKPVERAPSKAPPTKLSEIVPTQISIEDGDLTLQTVGQKPLQIRGVDLTLNNFSSEHPFPYRLALNVAGLKPISLEGNLSYSESRSTLTLKENHLKAQDIDFAVNGTIADLTGVPRMNLTLINDNFETKPIFQLLSAAGMTPKEMEVTGPMGLRVAANGPSNALNSQINIDLKGLKVNDSRSLKGTVVGKSALTALLGGSASIERALRGNGRIAVNDGVLTNVDLISKIEQVTGLLGLPRDQRQGATTFKTLETDFTLGEGVATFQRIYMLSPAMEANGNGKMTLANRALDIGIDVALSREVSGRAGSGKATTFFKDNQGRIVVPLKVTGPAQKPSVELDSGKLVQKGIGQFLQKGGGSFFDRLFKKK